MDEGGSGPRRRARRPRDGRESAAVDAPGGQPRGPLPRTLLQDGSAAVARGRDHRRGCPRARGLAKGRGKSLQGGSGAAAKDKTSAVVRPAGRPWCRACRMATCALPLCELAGRWRGRQRRKSGHAAHSPRGGRGSDAGQQPWIRLESPGISVFPATTKFSQLMMKSDRVTFTEVCIPRWRLRCILSHSVSFF